MPLDRHQLEKPLWKIRKLLKKMPANPTPDEVHDFRTNSRRIETMLPMLPPESRKNGKYILKRLSRLRKRAGKVRDMDVLTEYVSSVPHKGDEQFSIQLIEHLGAERQKHARKFHRAQRRFASGLRKRLRSAGRHLKQVSSRPGAKTHDEIGTAAKAESSVLTIIGELARPIHLNRTNLHPYRLKVKELRNLLRLSEGSKQQEFVNVLGEVKDAIGEWHDWQELVEIAKETLDHGSQCELMRQLKKTADSKYETAVALTEGMKKKYLRVTKRRTGSSKPYQPAQPVWSATAALAA